MHMTREQKMALFCAVILMPAVLIGISNFRVFKDSWIEATIMLVLTVVVTAVFIWNSSKATPKVAKYCHVCGFAAALTLGVNLGGHWLMTREYIAAEKVVASRREEEDRTEKRRAAEDQRALMLKKADLELIRSTQAAIDSDRARLRQLPWYERRSAIASAPAPAPAPAPEVVASVSAPAPAMPVGVEKVVEVIKRLTPEEVINKWSWFLTIMAYVDAAVSVVLGGLLFAVWEWDRNGNGVNDADEERARAQAQAYYNQGQGTPAQTTRALPAQAGVGRNGASGKKRRLW